MFSDLYGKGIHKISLLLQVIQECVARLDVAMFNGILRDPEDDSPTDPLADPITDLSVLPIPIGGLTFGAGSHLKNVVSSQKLCLYVWAKRERDKHHSHTAVPMQVVNWSTWLSALVSVKDRILTETSNGAGIIAKPKENEDNEEPVQFNLLKATGDLLMLPKDILLDSEIRKEVTSLKTLFILLDFSKAVGIRI